MANVFFTSDQHFGHNNILKYCPQTRPFGNIDIMNGVLIESWNDVVAEEDIVYVLGDFFMGRATLIDEILPQLNGDIYLIRGNHDEKNRIKKFTEYDIQILGKYSFDNFFGLGNVVLCHYPPDQEPDIVKEAEAFFGEGQDFIWLYGHVHDDAPEHVHLINGIPCYHVGVDTNDLTPISSEDLRKEFHYEQGSCNLCGSLRREE